MQTKVNRPSNELNKKYLADLEVDVLGIGIRRRFLRVFGRSHLRSLTTLPSLILLSVVVITVAVAVVVLSSRR